MSAFGLLIEKLDINIALIIYFLFFCLFFLFKNEVILYKKALFKNQLISIDFLILLSLLLHFIINRGVSTAGLSFAALFVLFSSLGKSNTQNNKNILVNSVMIAGFITLIGVLIGYAEVLLGNPTIFQTIQPANYPSPVFNLFNTFFDTNWQYQISGFQLSINYTAYMLIAALSLVDFMRGSRMIKMISSTVLIFAIILSQAKVGFLFLALLIIKKFYNFFYPFLISISLGYLFLAHITIIHSEVAIESMHYFRSKIFSIGGYDFYLSFFSWLKLSAFEYLHSVKWFYGNHYALFDLISADPHSFWISLVVISGPISTILVAIKFFKIEEKVRDARNTLPSIFYIGVYTLLIESLIWDAYDAPIFWIILLSSTSLFLSNDHRSKSEP